MLSRSPADALESLRRREASALGTPELGSASGVQ